MSVPDDPKIFHITHLDNLQSIVDHGGLWCDSERIRRGVANTNIGYSHIKNRRLSRSVDTSAGGCLGDYVPFNFCPRSVMLLKVGSGHENYGGGENSVLHLVSRVSIATKLGRDWLFTDRHAELEYALHFDDLSQLSEVRWDVMPEKYWKDVGEERQAEFLVREFFPLSAVEEVVAKNESVSRRAQTILEEAGWSGSVCVRPEWYYGKSR